MGSILFGKFKYKFKIFTEMWYEEKFKHVEFNGAFHLSCFRPKKPYLGKFVPENQICHFKLKLGA